MMRASALGAAIAAILLSACVPYASRNMPAIIGAARDGDIPRLEQLLRDGADPNVHAGVNDWTPLMHAIHKNQPRSVRTLLANGARVNETNSHGTTALIMAAGYGYAGIVQDLLRAGADPALRDNDGRTALSAAVGGVGDIDRFTVGKCQTDTVRALLAAMPNQRRAEPALNRALNAARLGGCSEVAQLISRLR
jgi:hypothetical protein